MAKKDPKVNVALTRSAWRGILNTLKTESIGITTYAGFWQAIDEIERQLTHSEDGRKRDKSEARARREENPDVCDVCENDLFTPGGYGGTGMCGPCATGEAATLLEE